MNFNDRQKEVSALFASLQTERTALVARLQAIDQEILRLQGEARLIKSQLESEGQQAEFPLDKIKVENKEVARQDVEPNIRDL